MAGTVDRGGDTTICILDTSVVNNIIPVPGRDQHQAEVTRQLKQHIENRVVLLLPMVAILLKRAITSANVATVEYAAAPPNASSSSSLVR